MKVNWTPEPAHTHPPEHGNHTRVAWTLWILAATAVVVWGICAAIGVATASLTYLLLGIFMGLILASIVLGFRNVKYLEPMRVARDRILWWRVRRVQEHRHGHGQHAPREHTPPAGP